MYFVKGRGFTGTDSALCAPTAALIVGLVVNKDKVNLIDPRRGTADCLQSSSRKNNTDIMSSAAVSPAVITEGSARSRFGAKGGEKEVTGDSGLVT